MIKNSFMLIFLVAIVAGAVWFFLTKIKSPSEPIIKDSTPTASISVSPSVSPETTSDENQIPMDRISGRELVVGTGKETKSGDRVKVNYVGTLLDGTKFDSSYDRGVPFEFNLGAGEVIKGWDDGVAGMKVGGKRQLIIPPQFGYGDRAVGKIPANSVLIFEVELLNIIAK
jgi:FKBP-type peptidyl-prolyl cis-trans isomerase